MKGTKIKTIKLKQTKLELGKLKPPSLSAVLEESHSRPEDIANQLPNQHPTLKKLKTTPLREDLKELSLNVKQKQLSHTKFLDFKAKNIRKDNNSNSSKQKSIDSFFPGSKPKENLVHSILFNKEKDKNSDEITNLGQSQPSNVSANNNIFNNSEKFKMSALQKALFYKRLEQLYKKTIERIPIFQGFINFMHSNLIQELKDYENKEFLNKIMKFCLLRFIFENPSESWHKIYKPLCCKDILNVKNTKCIKGWLEGFFKKQKEKSYFCSADSRFRYLNENSADLNSNFFDESSKSNHSKYDKLSLLQEIQDISLESKWKFNTLLIRGKQGIGKSTAVFSAAIDLEYEIIEINNSSKRSEKALKRIYEATQSQGIVSSHFKDFMMKVLIFI